MSFEILHAGFSAYFTLVAITLLAACIPFLWIRRERFAALLKKSAFAALFASTITLGIAFTLNENAFEVSEGNLLVQAAYFNNYSRRLDEFDLNNAQFGSYQSITAANLKWRKNGISLPGINAGYFSTNDGQSIFVVLTDRTQVLYLPAKSGTSLLVSVSKPVDVLNALKQVKSAH